MSEIRSTTRTFLWILLAVILLTGLSQTIVWRGPADEAMPAASEAGRLPLYALFSFLRMGAAFLFSLLFSLPYGYYAAMKRGAGSVLLPALDVMQSVPILGFFPAAIAVFVAVGGGERLGVEMAAVFLIFTCQAWNMAYGVYESSASVPADLLEVVRAYGLQGSQVYRRLYLPAAIPKLVYNSMLSWSNGWYFLIACEIISVGPVSYELPGLGSFLVHTVEQGRYWGTALGLAVQVAIIVALDLAVWRPLIRWSGRFKMEVSASSLEHGRKGRARWRLGRETRVVVRRRLKRWAQAAVRPLWALQENIARGLGRVRPVGRAVWKVFGWTVAAAAVVLLLAALAKIVLLLAEPWPKQAAEIPLALLYSTLRIAAAYAIALAWTLPVAVWAGANERVGRIVRPLAQIGASIPATGLFPVIVVVVVNFLGGMNVASVLLVLTGMQWYLLFNLLAGVDAIPRDLSEAVRSLGLSRWQTFKRLTLPAVLPGLITGSITGWGGAWNALILSETIRYAGREYSVPGIGSLLHVATYEMGNLTMMALTLMAMVAFIVLVNYFLWRRMYLGAVERFRMDL